MESSNDRKIPDGIGRQIDRWAEEIITANDIGIAMAHIGECCVAMLVCETLRGDAVIQQIEF
jgi:hypothetical protein